MLPGVSLQSTAAKYCTLQFTGVIHHAAGCSGARKKVPKPNGTCTEDLIRFLSVHLDFIALYLNIDLI